MSNRPNRLIHLIPLVVLLVLPFGNLAAQTGSSKSVDPFRKSSEKKKTVNTEPFQEVLDQKVEIERKSVRPSELVRKDVLEDMEKEGTGETPFGEAEFAPTLPEQEKKVTAPKKVSKKAVKKSTTTKDLFSEYDMVFAKGIADLFPQKK